MHDLQAFVAQVHGQQVGDMGIVFDQQHAFGGMYGHEKAGKRGMPSIVRNRSLPSYHEFLKFA